MKDVLQAIEERCSTRGYTDEKLTDAELQAILKAGLQAPTAANKQEIHCTVLGGDHPVLRELQEDLLRGKDGKPAHNFYYEAPTVIILSGREDFHWSGVDAGIAVENMALAAEGLGLGNLIIGCIRDAMTGEKKAHYADALKLPEGYGYQIAFAVGHKAVTKAPHEYDAATHVTCL